MTYKLQDNGTAIYDDVSMSQHHTFRVTGGTTRVTNGSNILRFRGLDQNQKHLKYEALLFEFENLN